jgi:nickel-dependent lactate racemase
VHEAFIEAAEFVKPSFAVNTIVNDVGEIIDLFCGDWVASHRKACEAYAASYTINIAEKRDVIIASCGGYPHDINMIQAHKALEAASHGCREGGTIIVLAECVDGLGKKDFLDWFNAGNSEGLAAQLCDKYQVNGQTAWSLLRKTERFDVRIISALDAATTEKMRLTPMQSLSRAIGKIDKNVNGYILPGGAKFHILG